MYATECSEFDTLRPDKGKKQDSENMEDNAQDGKLTIVGYNLIKNLMCLFRSFPSIRLGPGVVDGSRGQPAISQREEGTDRLHNNLF